jgi:hypothetical protein
MSSPFFIINMPIYIYQNTKTKEVREIIQSMNDEHVYKGENGNESWDRIFTVPTASIDSKIDPFSADQYVRATGNKKGTYGDLLDKSKELSAKRAEITGATDPIKDKFYKDYSKKRNGAKHPDLMPKSFENKNVKVEF